jgi:hypothetical protein
MKPRRDTKLDRALNRYQARIDSLTEWIGGRKTYPDHCGVPDLKWQPPVSEFGPLGTIRRQANAGGASRVARAEGAMQKKEALR